EVVAVGTGDRVVGVERVLDDADPDAVHLHRPDLQVSADLRAHGRGHRGPGSDDASDHDDGALHVVSFRLSTSSKSPKSSRSASGRAARTGSLSSVNSSAASGSQPSTNVWGSSPPSV